VLPPLRIEIDTELIGLVLVVVGVILLIVELATPGFFVAIPGSILLAIGLIMWFIPWIWATPWGIAIAIAITVSMSALVIEVYRKLGRGHKVLTPSVDATVGKEGVVIEEVVPHELSGKVRIGTETWSVTSDTPIAKGQKVVVVGGEGVHLVVKKVEK
jgi:membrane protein implicated in regulation of membrane protease activity